MAQLQHKDDFETDDFEADDFEPDKSKGQTSEKPSIFIKEEKDPNRSLIQRLAEPNLLEMDLSGPESLLTSGMNVGESIPGLNKLWPGGIHIPGIGEMYNELVRPTSSILGMGLMGLEGAINRFVPRSSNAGANTAEQPLPKLAPESLTVPEPKIGTPPYNTSQFGLHPSSENLPYPLNITPNRLRPPSTNATVMDALLPESLKLNEQGAALPPTQSLKNPSLSEPVTTKGGKYTFLDETIQKAPSKTVEAEVIPRAGQAKSFSDISPITANVTSADQTLASREITKPIADLIVTAQDKKTQFIASTERELSSIRKGLNKSSRIQLGKLIDGQEVPDAPLDLQQRAQKARVILDQIHEMFPEGATKSGEDVGYLENYFTHIQQQPTDIQSAISNVLDHHFGVFKSKQIPIPSTEAQEGIGDFFEKGTGHPSSPFVEERTGKAKELIYDVDKIFPAYIESAAKVIFDKPAVESATKLLRNIPDSNLKELATWYIKNYSRYDAERGLAGAWSKWANSIGRTTARSLLGFNTGLQTLHLARIPANLWPELGSKYTYFGLKQIANNPIQAWTETAKLGLLQNEIRPWSFKTIPEKFDSVSNFLSLADYLDKTAGYFGYKEKFMKELGLNEADASLKALRETKRVSQTVDPSRQMKLMSPQSNIAGGQVVSKLGWQFKGVPAKIVEQYINIARKAQSDPKQAARMLAGVGIVLGANQGLRTFHLDPAHMIPSNVLGAFGDTMSRVAYNLSKGNWEKALQETVLWATPGGKSLERQIKSGPSALQ